MKDKKESTEMTKEEFDRMYEEYEYQLEGERENAIYEDNLRIEELEIDRKIKELQERGERIRISRRFAH